jgi:predicted  nucleic acid-binding Zn-ribbon protein
MNATINAETARARVLDRLTKQEVEKMKAEAAAKAEAERQAKEAEERKTKAAEASAQIEALRGEIATVETRAARHVKALVDDFLEIARIGHQIDDLTRSRRELLNKPQPSWPDSAVDVAVRRFHKSVNTTLSQKGTPQSVFFGWLDARMVAFAQ